MTRLRTVSAAVLLGAASLAAGSLATAQVGNDYARSGQVAAFTQPETMAADLARIDATLNATNTFTGRFQQVDHTGAVDGGNLYISRPGMVRFEYDGPMLVVSDGTLMTYVDEKLETRDSVPLSATPLDFFLKNDVNLARDTDIVAFRKSPTEWRVSARDGSGEVDGVLTLVFDATTLALNGWVVDDAYGNATTVTMSDLRYNAELDPRLFVLRDEARRDRRR